MFHYSACSDLVSSALFGIADRRDMLISLANALGTSSTLQTAP
jgi:hypothetical protein